MARASEAKPKKQQQAIDLSALTPTARQADEGEWHEIALTNGAYRVKAGLAFGPETSALLERIQRQVMRASGKKKAKNLTRAESAEINLRWLAEGPLKDFARPVLVLVDNGNGKPERITLEENTPETRRMLLEGYPELRFKVNLLVSNQQQDALDDLADLGEG